MNGMLRGMTCLALGIACTLARGAAPTFAGLVDAIESRPRGGIGHVMAKINAGEPVRIAYFGGSITSMDGWRRLSREWLQTRYPSCAFTEIPASIGGTGSSLGVYRFDKDVLAKSPDLVFVEFATNDASTPVAEIWRNFDGFVRQAWRVNPEIDFVFVYTITSSALSDYSAGKCQRSASAMEQLADYYEIPSICFGPRVAAGVRAGTLVMSVGDVETAVPVETPNRDKVIAEELAKEGKILFSKDGVHPALPGHEIYLDSIKAAWPAMASLPAADHTAKLVAPFVDATLEKAKMSPVASWMMSGAWRQITSKDANGNYASTFGAQPWLTATPGAKMSFRFRGSVCKIYDLIGPACGQVLVTVDGVARPKPVARFDKYCTYYRVATLAVYSGEEGLHEVELELDSEQPDRSIVKVQGVTDAELATAKYDGTEWYVGCLMLAGDVCDDGPRPPKVTNAWFDADVENYVRWPRDADRVRGGSWSAGHAALTDVADVSTPGTLDLFADDDRLNLGFTEIVRLGDGVREVIVSADAAMDAYDAADLPTPDPSWKGSVVIGQGADGLRYYGLVREGSRNVWRPLDGVAVAAGNCTRLEMGFTLDGADVRVSYTVNGAAATVDGETRLPVVATPVFTGVFCSGYGKLSFLAGENVPIARGFQIRICRN